MTAHLLLRGERPQVLTGYTLVCHMYGHVTYIPRSEYANRDAMFAKHVDRLSKRGFGKVGVIKEGAGDAFALLGEKLPCILWIRTSALICFDQEPRPTT